MEAQQILHQQLLDDLDRLHHLILRYANGDKQVKAERDQLEGAVSVKMALWRGCLERGLDTLG